MSQYPVGGNDLPQGDPAVVARNAVVPVNLEPCV
jgi:hypothetical protein